jgi:hypothetical protein
MAGDVAQEKIRAGDAHAFLSGEGIMHGIFRHLRGVTEKGGDKKFQPVL